MIRRVVRLSLVVAWAGLLIAFAASAVAWWRPGWVDNVRLDAAAGGVYARVWVSGRRADLTVLRGWLAPLGPRVRVGMPTDDPRDAAPSPETVVAEAPMLRVDPRKDW